MKRVLFICSLIAVIAVTFTVAGLTALSQQPGQPGQQQPPPPATQPAAQTPADDLKRQLGTIIVTPGGGPTLAVADFQPRAGGVDTAVTTFNDVLWNDLQFAGAANLVGKSLYPRTRLADPSALKFSEWAEEPAKTDYVAFGNLSAVNEAQGFLFDVKTQQQLLSAHLGGDARSMAHQFADQIIKLLLGIDGIATSKIAYIHNREVYMMDYDGYSSRAFSRDGSMALFPSFSPDGRRLAYVSYRSGAPNIVIRSEDGLIIGSTQFRATTTSPAISPSGQVAFSSSKDGNAMEIYVANADGSGARRLTNTRNAVNISPRWNPKTGREIAFVSDRGGAPQIYVMDAGGGNERPLLALGGQMDTPSWSPDGRFIAFTWDGGGGSFQVHIADVASGQVVRLTGAGRNESPTWSPDSRHLVFQSSRTGRWQIWAMHIDGSGQRQLTRNGGRSPSWAR